MPSPSLLTQMTWRKEHASWEKTTVRCREGISEVVEVELRQSCGFTGPIKAMPYIIPLMPGGIMEDPRHIEPGS